jgi:hypothetical protein
MKFKRLGAEDWLYLEEEPSNCTGLLLEGSLRIDCSEPFWLTSGTQTLESVGGGPVRGLGRANDKVWVVHGEDTAVVWEDQEKKTTKAIGKLYAKYAKTRWKYVVAALVGKADVLGHMTSLERKNTRKNARKRFV